MLGMIGGALAVVAAGITLYNGQETRDDNERQRQHERDMARLALENPNSGITVQTGRIRHEHHIGNFPGLDSDTVSRITSSGISAINSSSAINRDN